VISFANRVSIHEDIRLFWRKVRFQSTILREYGWRTYGDRDHEGERAEESSHLQSPKL